MRGGGGGGGGGGSGGGRKGRIKRRKVRERRKSEEKVCDFSRFRPEMAGNKMCRMRRALEDVGHGVVVNAAFRAGWNEGDGRS